MIVGLTMCCTHNDFYYAVDKNLTIEIPDSTDTIHGNFVCQFDGKYNLVGIESVDSFVVLFCEHKDSLIFVMNSNNDSLIGGFGAIGRAKNEMIVPMRECQFGKSINGDILMYVDDFNKNSVLTFNFSKSLENNQLVYVKKMPYEIINQSEQFACFSMSDNEYVMYQGLAWEDDVRDEKTITPYVYRSSDSSNKKNIYHRMINGKDIQKTFIYNIMVKIKPDKSKLLLAHGNIGQFTILDLDSWKSIGVHEKTSYDFDYLRELAEEDTKFFFSKLKAYYTYCNVTDEFIIMSRDGTHSMREFEGIDIFQPMICLFDWSGNLIYSFIAYEEIGPIALNMHNKCIYGIGTDNNVYKYDLSKVL